MDEKKELRKEQKRIYQREYSKKTNNEAAKKWQKNSDNIMRVALNVYPKTESDIAEHLRKQENKAGYLKNLIRADIEKNKENF